MVSNRRAKHLASALLLVLCGLLGACSEPGLSLPPLSPTTEYQGRWEYRYGDPPPQPDGTFAWAEPTSSDGGWKPALAPLTPPGHGSGRFLWLRTRLMGPKLDKPMFHARVLDHHAEVFLDGKPILRTSTLPPQTKSRVGGTGPLFLPLPEDYEGKLLVLRIYSEHSSIGLFPPLRIGRLAELQLMLICQNAGSMTVGILLALVAAVGSVMFFLRRQEISYFYFSCFSLSTGVYIFANRNLAVYFLVPSSDFWWLILVCSLWLLSLFICAYYCSIFGPGPLSLLKWLIRAYLLFFLVASLLVAARVASAVFLLRYQQMLILITVVYLCAYSLAIAWQGNVDARIFGIGFFIAGMPVIVDLVFSLGWSAGSINSPPYSACILVLTLSIIIARRYLDLHRKLQETLRLELESAYAQRRLAEREGLLLAAAQMAHGDLSKTITAAPNSDLAPLAQALESMRRDLQTKIQTLEANNREIRELNQELRLQIEQRSRRVLDLALQSENKRVRKSHYAPGTMLGENYQVIGLLGQGAAGSVYEVERGLDSRRLAAKVLAARADKTTTIRFVREAQLLARLKHPNLISIVDVDTTESGVPYIVMELVRGTTLRHCQEQYGDLLFVMPVLHQIAEGLAFIHQSGIVHRDLKPANVLIAAQGAEKPPQVKLVDFGISTLAITEGSEPVAHPLRTGEHSISAGSAMSKPPAAPDSFSSAEMLIGTPMYMAPESRERSGSARPPADVFSFGVIAYELLCGKLPFEQPPLVLAMQGKSIKMQSLQAHCPGLSPELVKLVDGCLDENSSLRPSAAGIAAALSKALLEMATKAWEEALT